MASKAHSSLAKNQTGFFFIYINLATGINVKWFNPTQLNPQPKLQLFHTRIHNFKVRWVQSSRRKTVKEVSHLIVKNSWFPRWGRWKEMIINDWQNVIADLSKLVFNPLPVFLNPLHILFIPLGLLLLFNRRQDPPRCPSCPNNILIPNRHQIPLLHCQLHIQFSNFLHRFNHLWNKKMWQNNELKSQIITKSPLLLCKYDEMQFTPLDLNSFP